MRGGTPSLNSLVNQYRKVKVGHPIAKSILLYLADRYNPKTGCFPSQSEIANDLELSEASVHRYVIFLETSNFVTRRFKKFKGRIMTTYYEFNGICQIVSNGIPQIPLKQANPIPQIPPSYPTDTTYAKRNNVKKKKKKEINHSTQITRPDVKDDREYVQWLSNHPEYSDLGVPDKYKVLLDWCAKNHQTPSRQRLLNWLRKDRADVPMKLNGNGHTPKGCDVCRNHPNRNLISLKDPGWILDLDKGSVIPCECRKNGTT